MLLIETFIVGSEMTSYFFDIQGSARDAILPCLVSPLSKLRMLKLEMSRYGGRDEILALGCLLQSTPSLETFEIQIPDYAEEWEKDCMELLLKLSNFRRASTRAKISLKRPRIR